MFAKKITSVTLLALMALVSFVPISLGQGATPETEHDTILYFTNEVVDTEGSFLSKCGTQNIYELTTPRPDPSGVAYLNRQLLEANPILEACKTDFVYEVNGASFAIEKGDLEVEFDLGCDLVAGVAQPEPLDSVIVGLYTQSGDEDEERIAEGVVSFGLPAFICTPSDKLHVETDLEVPDNDTLLEAGDLIIIRIDLRALNTEPTEQPYWYLDTNPDASQVRFNHHDPPECSDEVDNDGDAKIDFPTDPGCDSTEDDDETDEDTDPTQCSDEEDNDGDGKIDFGTNASNDPGCVSLEDDDETDGGGGTDPQCSDGLDNDNDGKIDFGSGASNDPGCIAPEDDDETDGGGGTDPECSDAVDNDGDGKIDFGSGASNDPDCVSPEDDDESGGTGTTGDAPNCDRDEPAEEEVSRPAGTAFTLTAVCTDPDDDLDTGEWTDNDAPAGEEELGASPDEVSKEFTFDEPGTHIIELTPTDQEGQEGGPATWVVHVTDDSGEGDPPTCSRDEPTSFDITRPAGAPFTLRASCTDPDDDLDSGEWVVDDDVVAEDDLGDSPATADEEFEFDGCGTHTINFVPTDQAGNVGTAASWRVTVNGCDTTSPSPTETTPIPVFPSNIAFLLAAVGGLGGGFVILRRRGA